jgi:hypothetical protein
MKRSLVIVLVVAGLGTVHALAGLLFCLCDGLSGNIFPHLTQSGTNSGSHIPMADPFEAMQSFLHSNWIYTLLVAAAGFLLLLFVLTKMMRQELDKENSTAQFGSLE